MSEPMGRRERRQFRKQLPARLLGWLILLSIPCLVALLFLATRVPELRSIESIDRAQVARNLAGGRGYTTDHIRPISLTVNGDVDGHPDLMHPPVFTSLLAAGFAALHPSDRVAAAVGFLGWLLALMAAYIWAWRRMEPRIANLAALAGGLAISPIVSSLDAMPYGWLALGTILLLSMGCRQSPEGDESAEADQIPWIRTGLVLGLLMLTHCAFHALALIWVLWFVRRYGWKSAAKLTLVSFLIVLPWLIRKSLVGGAPWAALYWVQIAEATSAWPGDSVWTTISGDPVNPFLFPILHPLQTLGQMIDGLIQVRRQLFHVLDPLLLTMAILPFPLASHREEISRLRRWTFGSMGVVMLVACTVNQEVSLLLCWMPAILLLASANAWWVIERLIPGDGIRFPHWVLRRNTKKKAPRLAPALLSKAVAGLLLAVVALPLFHALLNVDNTLNPNLRGRFASIAESIPADAVVLTDQPEAMAWFGRRKAVDLPMDEESVAVLVELVPSLDAIFASSGIERRPAEARAAWWYWIRAPRGNWLDWKPAPLGFRDGVLRLREESE